METIREVFIANLVQLRGRRTQAQIAEAAGIPLRSYQRAEYGDIPHGRNLAAIARGLGVKETRLFLDPELMSSPEQALEVLRQAIHRPAPELSPVKREIVEMLGEPSIEDAELGLLHATLKRMTDSNRSQTSHQKSNNRKETK